MSAAVSRIGWYVHHHGAGHLTRFLAVRAALNAEVIVFSTLEAPTPLPANTEWVRLERDDLPETRADCQILSPELSQPDAGGLLHWAPLGHRGHAHRFARIAEALAARSCAAFVVDVSVEVALLVRLLGVPVVLFAQPGDRRDAPHELAFRIAARIIAPWPEGAHEPITTDHAPVSYVGGISRFASRERQAPVSGTVFLLGALPDEALSAAQRATPNFCWLPPQWVADPWPALCGAEIVVSWAGQNSVADIAAAGARSVVIAQPRPFAEQLATSTALDRDGLAVGMASWPEPNRWPQLLGRARALTPEWWRWQVDGAAERAAKIIREVAG